MGGKNISTSAQKLGAVSLQTSCYGTVIPLFWGQVRANPNVVYYTDFKATAHTTTQKSGKGGGKISNTSYTYTASVIFALSEGAVTFKTVFNNKDVGTIASFGFTTYPGILDQAVWPYLTSNHPADAYNYSGTALAVQANMSLDDAATMGNYSFELRRTGFTIADGQPGSPDCNPADIIPDFTTNSLYGAIPGLVTFADTKNYRDYCTAMGFFLSPLLVEQQAATQHLNDFLTATNSEIITSAGQLKIIPYGDQPVVANGVSWTPNTTPIYDLGPDDFIVQDPKDDPIQIKRTNPKDTFNCIPVEFLDRALQYNTNTAQVIEPVDAAAFGIRQDTAKQLHCISNATVAQKVSLILAQRSVYVRNQYVFSLGWRYCLLEPMDLVTLTEPIVGFNRKVVRITKIKEDAHGNLQVSAQEWPFGIASAAAYSTQSSDVAPVNQLVLPGNVNTPIIFDYPTYLTSNGSAALGVVAAGGPWWGGAQVFMSSDNATYQYVGTIASGGRFGVLSAAYGNNGPYDTAHTLSVNLDISNDPQLGSIDAGYNADFANLCLIENELISYQTATLVGAGQYSLTNMYRGVLGTVETSHAAGARFVRMDDRPIEIPITPARIGTTIYVKFASFNIFGKSMQDLADVQPYLYVPNPGWSVSNTSESFTVNGTVNGIAFTWGLGLLPGAYIVELYEGATASAYQGGTAVNIWSGNATGKLIAKNDTVTRYYWIRARAEDGRYGAISPSGNGIPGHATLVDSNMVLQANPGSATSSGAGSSQTTNGVNVQVLGGTPGYTYTWSWYHGGSGISIDAPSSATTTFSATGLALHEERTGTAKCVVNDSSTGVQTIFVNVEIDESASAPTASANPTSLSVSGASGSETTGSTTVTPTGGLGPYTYNWTWQLGGTAISIQSPTSATTTFFNGAMASGVTLTGTALCTVTDSLGQTATASVLVSLARVPGIGVVASPTSESTSSSALAQTTGTTTIAVSGGVAPYSYSWAWVAAGGGISIDNPSASATTFSAAGLSASGETRTGTARCSVSDSLGQTGYVDVPVSIQSISTSMTVTVSPSFVARVVQNTKVVVLTTPAVTVSVVGGSPGYTYSWSIIAGSSVTINNPAGASTTFSQSCGPGAVYTATAQCRVTDALGNTGTCTVSVDIENGGYK